MGEAESAVVRIGADWDAKKCVVAWRHLGKLHTERVPRDPESVEGFANRVLSLAQVGGQKPTLEVAVEAGDAYWVTLWARVAREVLVFDGKKTRRFSESVVSSGASDDKRSAKALLEMLESPAHRATANRQLPPRLQSLMLGLSLRKAASRAAGAASNRLYAMLQVYRPSLVRTVFGKGFLNVLEKVPTAASWHALDAAGREAVLRLCRAGEREALAEDLGKDLIAVAPELESIVATGIRTLVADVRGALRSEDELEGTLEDLLDAAEASPVIRGVKGIGPVLGCAVTAALGFEAQAVEAAKQDDSPAARAAARDTAARRLGAAPVTKRSGTKGDASPQVSMRRAANRDLRSSTHMLGLQLQRNYPWAKAACQWYRDHGKNPATRFRIIVRSFLRVMGACVRNNEAFDEARYVAALRSKGVEWALAMTLPAENASKPPAA